MARVLFLFSLIVLASSLLLPAQPAAGGEFARGKKCVLLDRRTGAPALVNRCSACRQVGVERSRPGSGFPTTQSFLVPDKSRQPLPFLGPGRTRVTGERPCPKPAGAAARPDSERPARCVRFTREGQMPLLVNPCRTCRSVTVERTGADGARSLSRYLLGPTSALPFPTKGAASAQIVKDASCS